MKSIVVDNLVKDYQIHKKQQGLRGSLKALFKREYTVITAADRVSFEVEQGELIGFIGPNGAGKTTTLKCLSGLLYPSSGKVEVLGFAPFERKHEFLKQISLVMGQKNQLFWDLPAVETFALHKEIYQIPEDRYTKVLGELVAMLEVEDVIQQQVRKMSLGQRMKCELIAALLHTPKVLFLDEPTIGLDVVMQKKLRQFVKHYNKEYNSTILLTSHYMGDVQELCERVIIIDHGKIGFDGKLQDLVKKYAPHKIITLVFDEPVQEKDLKQYGKIMSWEPLKVSLEVPRDQVKTKASQVLQRLPVDDLDISETPIEEVIGNLFEKKGKL